MGYDDLPPGRYRFIVEASDEVGNQSYAQYEWEVTDDSDAPQEPAPAAELGGASLAWPPAPAASAPAAATLPATAAESTPAAAPPVRVRSLRRGRLRVIARCPATCVVRARVHIGGRRVASASRRSTAGRSVVLRLRVPARWRGRRARVEMTTGTRAEAVVQMIRLRR